LEKLALDQLSQVSSSWGDSSSEKGEVYTQPSVVRFMLKVSGITDAILNTDTHILEPSCGHGEFVIAIAQNLCNALKKQHSSQHHISLDQVKALVSAFEVSTESIEIAKEKTKIALREYFSERESDEIVQSWFENSDFLLTPIRRSYNYVIGNPPYVRIESIPIQLLSEYRRRFQTMRERADLYIPFFERSLSLLKEGGTLCFICTDRWTKNKYGSALRELISQSFNLDLYVDLYGQDAFQARVLTYPAITQVSKGVRNGTYVIHNPNLTKTLANDIFTKLSRGKAALNGQSVREDIVRGSSPWLFGSADERELIRRLEKEFPLIEEVGCKVYIGAASGNKRVFEVDDDIDIESCRLVPLITARDLNLGYHRGAHKYLINTYDKNGVICLDNFPKLQRYLKTHKEELSLRHIAKKTPAKWYRTIDRVYPERAQAEKLLIPDIKSELTVVYDDGFFHPNNSLYYICSSSWSLRALQGVLISGIGQLFIEAYSTKVSGKNLRFQAQHLRKIRLPSWETLEEDQKKALEYAAMNKNLSLAKKTVSAIYNLSAKERLVLGG